MSNDNDGRHQRPTGDSSPDLSYLHPDNLTIGGIGVFAGDWAWSCEPPRIPVGFVGTLIDYWNGWAVWRCTREVAEAVVADQQRLRADERARLIEQGLAGGALDQAVDETVPPVWFDGDDLILDESAMHGEQALDRQSPGSDGRYCPMGFNWTWQAVDPADCDRIAGTLPVFGEHQEYVEATHQPLRMPHDRLTVSAVQPAPGGGARIATLCLDGQPVGTAVQTGGAPTVFHPDGTAFSHEDLTRFVESCRWRGRPTAEDAVLDALIIEYEFGAQIAAAEADGLVLVVLRDGDEHVVSLEYRLARRPANRTERTMMAELLTAAVVARYPRQTQFVWQVWTGTRPTLLGIVDVPSDGAFSGPEVPGQPLPPASSGSGNPPVVDIPPQPPTAQGDGAAGHGGTEQNEREQ